MTHNETLILSFSAIRAVDLPLVGGKGANLGEMTQAGFPIPSGFCLTTAAFQRFMDTYLDSEGIYTQLDTIARDDAETVRRVGERIRSRLNLL
jgi:pyruvate,water dikinase